MKQDKKGDTRRLELIWLLNTLWAQRYFDIKINIVIFIVDEILSSKYTRFEVKKVLLGAIRPGIFLYRIKMCYSKGNKLRFNLKNLMQNCN